MSVRYNKQGFVFSSSMEVELLVLTDLTYDELENFVKSQGLERYRADQIADWIYDKYVFNFEDMTNLSKQTRNKLAKIAKIIDLSPIERKVSKLDGTTKYLWILEDGNTVESVYIIHLNRNTACLSTQVGCPVGCPFCATGQSGFIRNLKTSEIVGQLLFMEKLHGEKVNNVVLMGMGEPAFNADNVFRVLEILTHPKLRNIGARRITVSTAGVPEFIEALGKKFPQVRLSVSLHAPNDEKRDILVPLNRKYPIALVIQALKRYIEDTGKRVTLEYVLINDLNDSPDDARELYNLLKGLKVHVNLIPLNPAVEGYKRPLHEKVTGFARYLEARGVKVTIRIEKGQDIDGACGQLRMRR